MEEEENVDLAVFGMELEKENDEAQLIEERRKKRQEMLVSLQKKVEKVEENENNNSFAKHEHENNIIANKQEIKEEHVMIRKPSASKADVEKYNYIKMVDAMREKNMGTYFNYFFSVYIYIFH